MSSPISSPLLSLHFLVAVRLLLMVGDDEDDDYQENDEYDIDFEEEAYDRIDQDKIDDLLAEPG